MPVFKELDPEVTRKLLEGYEDELTPAVIAQEAFYRQFVCKRCGKKCQKEFVRGHVFTDSSGLVPRACLRCTTCNCLFDPHSGLILETGS
jgi:hypothetical protein